LLKSVILLTSSCSNVATEKYLDLVAANYKQSNKKCWTIIRVWQVVYSGGDSQDSIYECVSLVCPIFSLFMTEELRRLKYCFVPFDFNCIQFVRWIQLPLFSSLPLGECLNTNQLPAFLNKLLTAWMLGFRWWPVFRRSKRADKSVDVIYWRVACIRQHRTRGLGAERAHSRWVAH